MIVVWREDANYDLFNIIDHIFAENPVAARKVAGEIVLAGESLAVFPRRGRIGRVAGTRELVAVRPYILVYKIVDATSLHIVNVWHGAQDKP